MAKPHGIQDQNVLQEHMIQELIAELQEIDEKTRVEVRFYELIA